VVGVTSREKVDWRVPSEEWDAFIDFVHREHGEIKGYVGREVERAMREWIDSDDFAPVEDRVDRLVQAAGRTPADLSQKKRASTPPGGEDTTRVTCRVDTRLKEDFAGFVKRTSDDRLGVALARALRQRRSGGRAQRVLDKLDRVIDDAEDLLAEVAGDGDLSLREKRTIAICDRLGPQFKQSDLEDTIADVVGDSPPTIRDYTDKVLDRLEYVQHPNTPDLFVPEDYARDVGADPDAPAIDRKSYAGLTREEKVRGLRIDLARRSMSNGGRYQIDADTVKRSVFDGKPSDGHARELLRLAGDADGFDTVRRQGKERLRVDLADVSDTDIRDAVDNGPAGQPSSTDEPQGSGGGDTVDDGGDDGDDGRDGSGSPDGGRVDPDIDDADGGLDADDPAAVEDQMDALMEATPVTDGGQERGAD